ncbi:arrestin domain-containing protein 3-like [Haliotis rubra]|uniref:arrestin domain-containing protein 3-like n=1 Tax=Haliotis rubra TaxID=36100 RepID=UPI001EE558F3|nr:arrestin domain-containing protein 3-like [Haliotis rubra]
MGKPKVFTITLDNPQRVYSPGQCLQGHLTLELDEEMEMKGIQLQLIGGARVKWSESCSKGVGMARRTVTKHYVANDNYFNDELVLFGKATGEDGDNASLSAGRYTYPFQYKLPPGIPSSFEATLGRVRYWLKGTITKPWTFDDTTKKIFTVANLLDLNAEPEAMLGLRGEDQETLCCLCCTSGPISCRFQIDRCGFVPGESIPIKAEIINRSNRKMKRSFAELYMVVIYHTTKRSRTIMKKICEISHGEILPGESDIWTGDLLKIPPAPPSNLNGCSIIDIDYYVKFCVEPAGPALKLEIPLKVLIGSVPLRSAMEQNRPDSQVHGPNQDQLFEEGAQADVQPAESLTPPSYAECMFGNVNIQDDCENDHAQGDFTPMYAYYNWGDTTRPSSHPQ